MDEQRIIDEMVSVAAQQIADGNVSRDHAEIKARYLTEKTQPARMEGGQFLSAAAQREIGRRLLALLQGAPVKPTTASGLQPVPDGMVRIRIAARDSNSFGKAIKAAKRVRGCYEPEIRTWLIPATANELNAPASYGWAIVD